MPQRPQGQQIAEHYDVSSPKPVGRSDALPNQGGTPYRAPSGRDDTDKPEGRPALFSTKSLIGIGTWNVRTLHQEGNLNILLHQLDKFKWEIIGISETHWTETGEFTEEGYKILCSSDERLHRKGVALILNKTAHRALIGYNPISSRLITARFHTQIGAVTVIQVYAPNTGDPDEVADEFYDELQHAVNTTPSSDMLVIMGDFNAKVGSDNENWQDNIGKFGYGERNNRGELLLHFCASNGLFITNTCFKQSKAAREWTWESPDGSYHNKIDYILVSRKMRSSVTNSRSFPSADIGSDHQLIITNIKLKLKAKKKQPNIMKRYDVSRLKSPTIKSSYETSIGGKFGPLLNLQDTDVEPNVNDIWTVIKDSLHDTSEEILGVKRSQPQQPWISQDILMLSDKRSELKLEKMSNPSKKHEYNYLTREIKRKSKSCKEKWIKDICKGVEEAQQSNKTREVYAAINKLTRKSNHKMQSVKGKDGKILTEEEDVKNRWKENYQELYNTENPCSTDTLNTIPVSINCEEEPGILREEVERAIKQLREGKAPGYDSVTAEELKAAGEPGIDIMHQLCIKIWESETFPEDWGRAVITPIYKKKDKLDCNNYRGISLLSHAGKVMTKILHLRIKERTETILSEAQAGFRPGRGTIDQLFTLRQLTEKYLERGKRLYICYIDFEKAFDRVWQRGLWHCMTFFGFPKKIISLLQALYRISQSTVRVNGSLTDWFPTCVGVRQGCIISPPLFNIILEVAMLNALYDQDIGARINGHIINNLRFADDIALIAETEEDLQKLVTLVSSSSSQLGLKISITKTQVQVVGKEPEQVNITVDSQTLEQVKSFTYLGGVITENALSDQDITRRIGLAHAAMRTLNTIWTAKDITIPTKVTLYQTLVLPIVLYGSETWTLKAADERRLNTFEMSCLRRILGVSRRERLRNDHIRATLGINSSIHDKIHIRRLTYYGHVTRMDNTRFPQIALEGDIQGTRPRGRPPKRWTDCLRESCSIRGATSLARVKRVAEDRRTWRTFIRSCHLDSPP